MHLRAQFNIVETKYPVEIEIIPQDNTADNPNASMPNTGDTAIPSFKATVTSVNRAVGSKVMINFFFDFELYAHWPMALKKTKCEVQVLMGPFKCVFYSARRGCPR